VSDYKRWKCHHFSMALSREKIPTLLRRVAAQIEKIKPEVVLDIVLKTDYTDMIATVYYSLPKRTHISATAKADRKVTRRKVAPR
jgi:hypothetical protein